MPFSTMLLEMRFNFNGECHRANARRRSCHPPMRTTIVGLLLSLGMVACNTATAQVAAQSAAASAAPSERQGKPAAPAPVTPASLPKPQDAEISIKSGESVDLGPVYWVQGCTSLLVNVVGVDLLEGPPGITLSVRREDVLPERPGCTKKVNGGVIVASVKDVAAPAHGVLRYRVRYTMSDGRNQSTHTRQIGLYP